MRRGVLALLGAALVASLLSAASASEPAAPLEVRLRAAIVVVDGQAGRSYTAWNGTDPATIVTYTPFAVQRVLKGRLPNHAILLRESGGDAGGASAVGGVSAGFSEGERDIVLLGEQDPRDGSYPITINRGSYLVTPDADGLLGVDVRLGVDARSYASRERGPGTQAVRVPLTLVERLARGDGPGELAPAQVTVAPARSPTALPAAAKPEPAPARRWRAAAGFAAVLALLLTVFLTVWRQKPRR